MKATRTTQPYRKSAPTRGKGGALTAMLAGKPTGLPNPSHGPKGLTTQLRRMRSKRGKRPSDARSVPRAILPR